MKKSLAFILVFIFILSSCAAENSYDRFMTFNETSTVKYDNGLSDNTAVMRILGYDIPYSLLRYYYLSEIDEIGKDEWNMMSEDEKNVFIKDFIKEDILFPMNAAIVAKNNSVNLSSDDISSVEEYIDEITEKNGGKDKLQTVLDQSHMTYSLFRFLSFQSQIIMKIIDCYQDESKTPVRADDSAIEDVVEKGEIIHIKHILIMEDDETDGELSKAKIDEIYQRLNAGENFDRLMENYSDDPSLSSEPDGYFITRHAMNDRFCEEAFKLDVGEYCSPFFVVSDNYRGWHIILREEITDEQLSRNFEDFRLSFMTEAFYSTVYEMCDATAVEYLVDGLDFSGIE